jgi:hypothetical protein
MGQSIRTSEFFTQAERIEDLLRSRYGVWIPAYELADVALQYCARINAIRKKLRAAGDTEQIENQTKRVNGQVHGSYRICQKAPISKQDSQPSHPRSMSAARRSPGAWKAQPITPSRTWAEITAERERKLAESREAPVLVLTP